MTTNIEAIRAAQAQIPRWRDQLRALQAEAQGDDGVIDAEEQAEIDQVENLIDTANRLTAERLQAWANNRNAYETIRSRIATDLTTVEGNSDDAFSQDKRAVSDAVPPADQAASVQDFATALHCAQELERLIHLFLEKVDNERLNGLTTEELAEMDLADDAINDVFTEDYMEELKDMEFPGEGTPALKEVIKKIEKGLSSANRAEVLGDLASIVGEPPTVDDLDADYTRYLILVRQRDAIGEQNGQTEPDDVDEEKHPDFVGSHEQLMFGKVLGDALGIHEVFATLLSPTGGLVGPGNDLIPGVMASPHLSPDNPVALHGTVHDAAGYLHSFHNDGPGYNYRDNEIEGMVTSAIELLPESWENTLLPLTGQVSGIAYWTMEAGDEYIEARFDEGLVALDRALASARDSASDQIDEIISAIEVAKQELSDKADALRSDMEDAAEDVAEHVSDLVDEARAEVLEAGEALEDGVEKVSEAVVETVGDISDTVGDLANGVGEKLDALANFIWN